MDEQELKALGESADRNAYPTSFTEPEASLLEGILFHRSGVEIRLHVLSFTSLCPVTGQPDYGEIFISYVPGGWIVESKSLKLYLMSYRQHGAFGETIAAQVRDDLVGLLHPERLKVSCHFLARGDIRIVAEAEYDPPDDPPDERYEDMETNEWKSPIDGRDGREGI